MSGNKCKPIPQLSPSDIERFNSFVPQGLPEDACWPWLGRCYQRGYGRFYHWYNDYRAHRVAYTLHVGELGELDACHICDNPPCVNWRHLFKGTTQDNTADKMRKGRHKPRRGPRPKIWGEKNHQAKLTEQQVIEIRAKHSQGISDTKLAFEYNVSRALIYSVSHHRAWTHIKSRVAAKSRC
jgi:hypothetical protein